MWIKNSIKILFATCLVLAFSFTSVLKISTELKETKAAEITKSEAVTEKIDALRLGYNVTSGVPLCERGHNTSAYILKPMDQGLYKYIIKSKNNTMKTSDYVASSAIEIAQKSSETIGFGVKGNIKMISMDIGGSFRSVSRFSNIHEERYETYYQRIERISYQIENTVDLRNYLDDNFRKALLEANTVERATALFDLYGTHLFTGFQYGGLMQFTNYQATDSSNFNLSKQTELQSKIETTISNNQLGENFSFSSEYINNENRENQFSSYLFKQYGGDAVWALTMDQLFEYNPSYVDGKGNSIYDRWVCSINDDVCTTIVGIPSNAKSIPLWELLPNNNKYIDIRNNLVEVYAKLCEDKYSKFCKQYPTIPRVIDNEKQDLGLANLKGYSVEYNSNVIFEQNDTSKISNVVRPNSKIFMNVKDNISNINKNWRIIKGEQFVDILDDKEGIFQVKPELLKGSEFVVAMYDGNELLPSTSTTFTVIDGKFSGGDGTDEYPYLLSNKEDIIYLFSDSSYWDKNFKMTDNIDMGGELLVGIGTSQNMFSGVFDGNNCSIYNFKINDLRDQSLGLFAYNSGTVKNLTIGKADYSGNMYPTEISYTVASCSKDQLPKYIGSFIGYNKGILDNCKLESVSIYSNINLSFKDKTERFLYVGGLVGLCENGIVKSCAVNNLKTLECFFVGSKAKDGIEQRVYIGGAVGGLKGATISSCTVRNVDEINSNVTARINTAYSAGLVAKIVPSKNSSSIENCIVNTIGHLYAISDGRNDDWGVNNTNPNVFPFANDGDATVTDSFLLKRVKKADEITPTESTKCLVKDIITLDTCSTLSKEIWQEDLDKFPVLKTQVFDPNNVLILNLDNVKRDYYYGQDVNITGLTIQGKYMNSAEPFDINSFKYSLKDYDPFTVGGHNIIIKAMGFETKYQVSVHKIKILGLDVELKNDVKFYTGNKVDINDFEVNYILEDGRIISSTAEKDPNVEYLNETINTPYYTFVTGDNEIEFTCGKIKGSIIVKAEENEVVSINKIKDPNKLIYSIGDSFNLDGAKFEAVYNNGKKGEINNSDVEIIGNKILPGNNIVIIAYGPYKICKLEVVCDYSKFNIKFVDYDGRVIDSKDYELGEVVQKPSNPTREADNTYTYEFAGWDNEIVNCEGNKIYTATYKKTYIEYEVVFKNEDGTVLSTNTYHYGDSIIEPTGVVKESNKTYKYIFKGWNNPVDTCKGNATYIATFTAEYINYIINYIDSTDNSVIVSQTYHYGDNVVMPQDPEKDGYKFIGWDKTISTVEGNDTITAKFEKDTKKKDPMGCDANINMASSIIMATLVTGLVAYVLKRKR